MGKLQPQNTPGFNAGNNYVVKYMRVSDIVIDKKISEIFKVQENIRYRVVTEIKESGYDKSQPLTILKGTNTLLDGHTRLSAAIEAGLDEVPVVEKEFDDLDAAIKYTILRQAVRRNLTPTEIFEVVKMLPEERNKKGEGSFAGQLAEMLGLNVSTIYDAKKILREATPEVIEKVKNKEMSFKSASRNPTGKTIESVPSPEPLPEKDPSSEEISHNAAIETIETKNGFSVTDAYGLPENVKFLKGAVILLVEAKQQTAAELLVKHYLRKKNEKDAFYKLLPDSISETLISSSILANGPQRQDKGPI